MHYVDTSVLIAYLTPEPFSEQADQALRAPTYQPLSISAWTETELVSALGIKCGTNATSLAIRIASRRRLTPCCRSSPRLRHPQSG